MKAILFIPAFEPDDTAQTGIDYFVDWTPLTPEQIRKINVLYGDMTDWFPPVPEKVKEWGAV